VKKRIRKELRLVYRDPESAYAVLDFTGSGKIKIINLLENLVIQRLKISDEDIILWLLRDKIFKDEEAEIHFDMFKKAFFPHLC
jgi:hypothetical protein